MRRQPRAIILVFVVIFAARMFSGQEKGPHPAPSTLNTTQKDLLADPVAENWPSYNGDYTGRRFSSLNGINRSNVARMRAAWIFHPGNSQRLEATPIVVRGVMYVTSANDVFALDAATGRTLWHY